MEPAKRTLTGTLTFKARVNKKNEHVTHFTIYRCRIYVAKMRCHETWLWSKRRHTTIKTQKVSRRKCNEMLQSTKLHRNKWQEIRTGQYFWKTKDHYTCKYTKTVKKNFLHQEISSYRAIIKGSDKRIKTRLTRTHCAYHSGTHVAAEDGTRLIWNVSKTVDFSLFKYLGHLTVHQVGEWYMIPALYSGGPAQKVSKDGNNILLQGGLEIIKDATSKANERVFNKLAKEYFKKFERNDQVSMLGAHITDLVSLVQAHVNLLHDKVCVMKGKISSLESFIMETIPQAAHRIQSEAGVDYIKAGDAMIRRKCREIPLEEYEIKWNRKLGNECFKFFPVEYKGILKFLELPSHRMTNHKLHINCSKRHLTFIKDTEGNLYAIEPEGNLTMYREAVPDFSNSLIYIKDQQGFSELLGIDKSENLQPLTLLQLINEAAAPIQELQKISNLGNGSVMSGILSGMGAVISTGVRAIGGVFESLGNAFGGIIDHLSKVTATIVKATGGGVAQILDSTGQAIGETERGFTQIIQSVFGGIATAANSLILLSVIGYLAYEKWRQGNRFNVRR